MILYPDPVPPVTADGTLPPQTEEWYQSMIGTSPITPGNVSNWSVTKPFPVPTSTDRFVVPDTVNGTVVAFFHSSATGSDLP